LLLPADFDTEKPDPTLPTLTSYALAACVHPDRRAVHPAGDPDVHLLKLSARVDRYLHDYSGIYMKITTLVEGQLWQLAVVNLGGGRLE